MKQAIKAALWSGLVFPGLGHLVLKRPARGLAIMAVALAGILYIVKATLDAVLGSLSSLDNPDLANLATVSGTDTGPAVWVLGICWLVGVVDAYRLGARIDAEQQGAAGLASGPRRGHDRAGPADKPGIGRP